VVLPEALVIGAAPHSGGGLFGGVDTIENGPDL
jgi:hypothetical protein